ncbi:hypothetical protein QGN32_18720 [Mycolicibacterium sp. ND9-15]|uniref:hypothetical protein n=1 Tax=Mycolicibacterium sp. ND9-15 TaxID=3042320 RepID=UPI002DD84C60|nr:hypothetical protein [Mycolicibacterium sp. ND9-15]WSE55442.1 hypothetical protein QGN32_18720 [Mycolicibacterium sp. ND9-15]
MTMTTLKKIAAGSVMVGALGFTSVGLGASQAVADDHWWWDPPSPGHIAHIPGVPPPGHIAHIPGVPPPGHWDKPWKWWR